MQNLTQALKNYVRPYLIRIALYFRTIHLLLFRRPSALWAKQKELSTHDNLNYRRPIQIDEPFLGDKFFAAPVISKEQPGFDFILSGISSGEAFFFLKINHGSWERLARLKRLGIDKKDLIKTDGGRLDAMLKIRGSKWAEGGLLSDVLSALKRMPDPSDRFAFVPSVLPWPDADRIEGTPHESRSACTDIIEFFVPRRHIENKITRCLTGHELKAALISGRSSEMLIALRSRAVIFVGNIDDKLTLDGLNVRLCEFILVDAKHAKLQRKRIRAELFKKLSGRDEASAKLTILAAMGEMLTTWLGLEVMNKFPGVQFIDTGGFLGALGKSSQNINWTKVYGPQVAKDRGLMMLLNQEVQKMYEGTYGIRDEKLVELASEFGVETPTSVLELPSPLKTDAVAFIENKIYDFSRIEQLLNKSIELNHHANFGPIATLLEKAVHATLGLGDDRRVVAVSNGTVALHIVCGQQAAKAKIKGARWLSSAFTFFSANVGPLSDSKIIDCNEAGGFDLEGLKAVPLDQYDGVVYTNVFAEHSDWSEVQDFCSRTGKIFVVDNATGLLDRPSRSNNSAASVEIISAHHTKPWGVGEGGFIICGAEDETSIRSLLNFGIPSAGAMPTASSNAKMSDLAAAAIFDRLERMNYWSQFYHMQERRIRSCIEESGLPLRFNTNASSYKSPRAYTPCFCEWSVKLPVKPSRMTLRKYYRPLVQNDSLGTPTPNANQLFARNLSISNAPEMRLLSDDEIVAELRTSLAESKKST